MGDEQDGKPQIVPKLQKLFLHLPAGEGVQRREGLVHQQDVGFHGHGPGDGDALLHAARQHVRVGVDEFGQVHFLDEPDGLFPGLALGFVFLAGEHGEHDVLTHRLPGEELVEFLKHHHPVGAGAGDRVAPEGHRSFVRSHETGDTLEHGRLAAPRRSEKDEAVRREYLETDPIGRRHQVLLGFVLKGDTVHLQQRIGGGARGLRHRHGFNIHTQLPGRS